MKKKSNLVFVTLAIIIGTCFVVYFIAQTFTAISGYNSYGGYPIWFIIITVLIVLTAIFASVSTVLVITERIQFTSRLNISAILSLVISVLAKNIALYATNVVSYSMSDSPYLSSLLWQSIVSVIMLSIIECLAISFLVYFLLRKTNRYKQDKSTNFEA